MSRPDHIDAVDRPPAAKPDAASAAALNRDCPCTTLDDDALAAGLVREIGADAAALIAARPHLFSRVPAFVSAADFRAMRAIVAAVEAASRLAPWRERVFARAQDAVYRAEFGPRGVFMGYDFHVGIDGPKLIEINTNAGGAYLNAALRAAQGRCCAEGAEGPADFDAAVRDMFLAEWRLAGRVGAPGVAAIVDDNPLAQYLYPEFRLAAAHFERSGAKAVIADPAELEYAGGRLFHRGAAIDLVYNRLVDFGLAEERHAALRAAYLDGAVVLTPSPDRHALLADKRNLLMLSDLAALEEWGLQADHLDALSGLPPARAVRRDDADALWTERRRLVFKPAAGAGGKGVWRGDKLTKGVFEDVVAGGYIAQGYAPPGRRSVRRDGAAQDLKMDLRVYAYDGAPLMLAARLYEGQITNFRTPGGGFAPVHIV